MQYPKFAAICDQKGYHGYRITFVNDTKGVLQFKSLCTFTLCGPPCPTYLSLINVDVHT